jgi:hypothetical protein
VDGTRFLPPPFLACTAVVESPAKKNAGDFGDLVAEDEALASDMRDNRVAMLTERLGFIIILSKNWTIAIVSQRRFSWDADDFIRLCLPIDYIACIISFPASHTEH